MTTNRLLLNLNRNATTVDRLMMQLSTGKRIQNPSDNPIIASRALRFRTNVSEVQQFQRNADKATSWMEVSEQAMRNMTDLMERINELLVQGASSTYTYQNRQTIAREIEMMFDQINQEMNGTFAGRHVFSGFRTDIPPIAVQNNLSTAAGVTPENYVNIDITKMITNLDFTDVGVAFWRDPANPDHLHVVATYDWLNREDRVPADWENNPPGHVTLQVVGAPSVAGGPGYPHGINIMRLPYQARYDNNGNLIRDVTPPDDIAGLDVRVMSIDGITHSVGGVAVAPGAPVNPYMPISGEVIFIRETGEFIVHSDDIDLFNVPGGVNVTYNIDGVFQGELEPRIFFEMVRHFPQPVPPVIPPNPPPQVFTQVNQDLMFELGTSTRLAVNTRATAAYPWQFFAEMQSLLSWVNGAHSTATGTMEQQAAERSFFIESLHTKFTNFIGQMESHMQTTSTEATALGSRMNRVELISARLDENEDTFTALMSQNENVDYIEALMRFNAAEAVLQAAMQIGARIAQISLVNFI